MVKVDTSVFNTPEGVLEITAGFRDYEGRCHESAESMYHQLKGCPVQARVVAIETDTCWMVEAQVIATKVTSGIYRVYIQRNVANKSEITLQPVDITPQLSHPIGISSHHTSRPTSAVIRIQRIRPSYKTLCRSSFELVLQHPELSDIRVICGPKDAPAIPHSKFMLASASPFFKQMFSVPCTEVEDLQKNGTIHMPNWSRLSFLLCSLHMCTGWMPTSPLPEDSEVQICLKEHGRDPGEPLSGLELADMVKLAGLLGMIALEHDGSVAAARRFIKDADALEGRLEELYTKDSK